MFRVVRREGLCVQRAAGVVSMKRSSALGGDGRRARVFAREGLVEVGNVLWRAELRHERGLQRTRLQLSPIRMTKERMLL